MMYVKTIDENVALLTDRYAASFYEYTDGELKKSNAFFKQEDAFPMSDFKVYTTSFRGKLYVHWREGMNVYVKTFMRLISKSDYKAYFEDETGDIWILSVIALAEGDISDTRLIFKKKGES